MAFQGVKAFKEKQLKSIMETNEKDLLSWITSSGLYKKELLEKDLEKIAAFYYNQGYLKAKVGEPEVKHEGDWLYVTIPIEEGPSTGWARWICRANSSNPRKSSWPA